tara:strand:- start:125 stop:481 length:357 start_codon:yes stop_codon:yes gene_type:complete
MIFFIVSLTAAGSIAGAPDEGKAEASINKVFNIIDGPSPIDALADDKSSEKVRLDLKNVKGEIEFENVWFRYPTRKEDFVLRGLTLKINPSESVALVGESGCGKSTFINLMMRFYDPN